MDLGIQGRRAIVCASSKGLGRACAEALAAAGVDLVLNARNRDVLDQTAEAIRTTHGVSVTAIAADITTDEGREAVLTACADPDILVNNAGGPPPGDFRNWSREDWLAALDANMLTPIELIKATVDGMMARGFGRIVNITSSSVKAPIEVLGLSNGARSGLTGFVAGIARKTVRHNVTINNLLPGLLRHRPAGELHPGHRQGPQPLPRRRGQGAGSRDPRRPLRPSPRIRRGLRLPLLDPCRLCHRPELAARRRGLSRDVLRSRLLPHPLSLSRALKRERGTHREAMG